MGLFQRFIKRSKQRVWAFGPIPDLPVSSHDGATMAGEMRPKAGQHRVRHSSRIVDRTSDLSAVKDGDSRPVLDLGQEGESNEGMSSDYVGNSNVSSVLTDSDPSVTLHTQDLQSGGSQSENLESDSCVVKNGIQISDPQSCKAHKTESENERVELDAGEETGLPRGNRAGPVADIILPKNQTKMSRLQRVTVEPYQSAVPDMDADGMLFKKNPLIKKKSVPEKGNDSAVPLETSLGDMPLGEPLSEETALGRTDIPGIANIPAGVRRALKKVQADFAKQPQTGFKGSMPAQDIETQKVSIGRVSVRVKLPEPKVPAHKPAPSFCAEKLASRYFMGEA